MSSPHNKQLTITDDNEQLQALVGAVFNAGGTSPRCRGLRISVGDQDVRAWNFSVSGCLLRAEKVSTRL